jgi:hypothetical protein
MRVRIITKGYGTVVTAHVPFDQCLFDAWVKEWEATGDNPECVSVVDEKGNTVILNKDIVKESIIVVEK